MIKETYANKILNDIKKIKKTHRKVKINTKKRERKNNKSKITEYINTDSKEKKFLHSLFGKLNQFYIDVNRLVSNCEKEELTKELMNLQYKYKNKLLLKDVLTYPGAWSVYYENYIDNLIEAANVASFFENINNKGLLYTNVVTKMKPTFVEEKYLYEQVNSELSLTISLDFSFYDDLTEKYDLILKTKEKRKEYILKATKQIEELLFVFYDTDSIFEVHLLNDNILLDSIIALLQIIEFIDGYKENKDNAQDLAFLAQEADLRGM